MEFTNFTPFPAIAFQSLDRDNNENHTAVMRATFDIIPDQGLKLAAEQEPLAMTDEYFGEINKSSVRQESDLSPYKPKCDVIVIGSAYAPGGKPAASFEAALNITTPSVMTRGQIILSKKLTVTGPRFWEKQGSGWTLTEPEPIVSMPLQYEYAYGGECRINKDDPAAKRVDEEFQLTPEEQQQHSDGPELAPVAHATYEQNPVGIGFTEQWYVDATKPVEAYLPAQVNEDSKEPPVGVIEEISRFLRITHAPVPAKKPAKTELEQIQQEYKLPAPQIESPQDPIKEFGKHYEPQGLGVLTKDWEQRLKLAGTYDDNWLKEKWPSLPDDFDFAYWNCAHPDLQAPYPKGDEAIELTNLTPQGTLKFKLPSMLIYLTADNEEGEEELVPVRLDTVIIEPETMKASLVWRAFIKDNPEILSLEARMILKEDKDGQNQVLEKMSKLNGNNFLEVKQNG